MRIIAGEFRGRQLLAPPDDQTRPITDRAKQSLFDILAPQIPGATIYDCFAGTGSMGLECLSRGATHATFFENHRPAINALRKNIQSLNVSDQSTLITTDLFQHFRKSPPPQIKVTIIFLDPPYRYLYERSDELISVTNTLATNHLAEDGIIVFRHDSADTLSFPDLHPTDTRTYGSMTIHLLQRHPPGG